MKPALARILAPISAEEFLKSYWERSHLLVRGGIEKLAGLPDLAEIDRMISENGSGRPFITPYDQEALDQVRARGATPIELQPEPLAVSAFFCERGKIVLNAAHRYSAVLARLRNELARELGVAAQVNVYLAAPHGRGAEPHYDPHDVIVIHLAGEKRWKLWDAPLRLPSRLPLDRHREALQLGLREVAGRSPIAELTMSPGDVLYFPRGTLHAVEPTERVSLHLTIGLAPLRFGAAWAAAMHGVLDTMREDPRMRRHVVLGGAIGRHLEDEQAASARAAARLLASRLNAGEAHRAASKQREVPTSTRGGWLRALRST